MPRVSPGPCRRSTRGGPPDKQRRPGQGTRGALLPAAKEGCSMDLGTILAFIIIGLIAGAVARFLVPGPDPMGWIGTIVLGIIGSFVGGFLANLIFGGTVAISPAGIVGSIIGAIIVLLVWRQVGGRRAVV